MSVLQAAPLADRLSDSVRATTARVILGATATAWLALSIPWPGRGSAGQTHDHHAHAVSPVADVVDPWSLTWMSSWLLMVIAMMWPLAVPTVGAVSRSSYRGWRARLPVVCLATVTALWLAVGLAGALLARSLGVPAGSVWWQLAFVGLALAAFRSARRTRVLETCLRLPPLAPGGRRGVVTAARAGLLTWRRCVVLCGPVMLAMSVGHSAVLMVCASLAAWWESWHPRAWRDPVPVMLVAAGGLWLLVSHALAQGVGHG
ncbi:DUF2182 domain-containing protein [Nocardioides cavernae]|uniref:DUF2182 domain-containing protein n=1 Tax=Nocardioides cavernae TaxID=1921566 RepID=A0ABR8NDX4_9ACTN|nr:DUF2182 domain-containing protein [Nocardioides cavernae]MBD3926334.1 DUF2182 domain-containing protein [Nocardioides cavernae]MBM7513927.1 hypothetical protein [Nocardioides cavernae]